MPIPDDGFFERWEIELPPEEREVFCRDGVVDEAAWGMAPLRVLFVTAEPNVESRTAGAQSAAVSRDLRSLNRERGGGGAFGTPMARWTAMLLDGLSPFAAAALDRLARRRQVSRVAQINLKKTGGGAATRTARVCDWSALHRERLRDQLGRISPDVVVLCGGHVHAAWPNVVTGAPVDGLPVDGLVVKTVHPSAPGFSTMRKDATIAAVAASPEIAALRQ